MMIKKDNVTAELFCAMRVHLMNESEIGVFCPADAFVWEDNCQNVEFMNFTAVSEHNEMKVIGALRSSILSMLGSYPTTMSEDEELIKSATDGNTNSNSNNDIGPILLAAYQIRYREKDILKGAMEFLDDYQTNVTTGNVTFQIELKRKEREEADLREIIRKAFITDVKVTNLKLQNLGKFKPAPIFTYSHVPSSSLIYLFNSI
jgi:hypothetical protein